MVRNKHSACLGSHFHKQKIKAEPSSRRQLQTIHTKRLQQLVICPRYFQPCANLAQMDHRLDLHLFGVRRIQNYEDWEASRLATHWLKIQDCQQRMSIFLPMHAFNEWLRASEEEKRDGRLQ